jgi:hypothetical protein
MYVEDKGVRTHWNFLSFHVLTAIAPAACVHQKRGQINVPVNSRASNTHPIL